MIVDVKQDLRLEVPSKAKSINPGEAMSLKLKKAWNMIARIKGKGSKSLKVNADLLTSKSDIANKLAETI